MTKALIVGGGIAGLSTAWALARRGFTVELFEQGPLPNPRASSYDEHRITRHAYGRMEGYAHLMPEAFRVWDSLWNAIGTSHYERCNAVYFMRRDNGWFDSVSRSLTCDGRGLRGNSAGPGGAGVSPMVIPDGLLRVVSTQGAGMLFPVRILTDLVVLLGRLGVVFPHQHPGHRGRSGARPRRGRWRHACRATSWWSRRAPGRTGWCPRLRGVGVPSRQAVLYLSPPADMAEAWSKAPVMLDLREDGGGTYTLPPRRGTRLKVGDHVFSRTGRPGWRPDRHGPGCGTGYGRPRGPAIATWTATACWNRRRASTR